MGGKSSKEKKVANYETPQNNNHFSSNQHQISYNELGGSRANLAPPSQKQGMRSQSELSIYDPAAKDSDDPFNKTGVSKAEEFFNSLRDNPNNQLNKLRKFPFKLFLIN